MRTLTLRLADENAPAGALRLEPWLLLLMALHAALLFSPDSLPWQWGGMGLLIVLGLWGVVQPSATAPRLLRAVALIAMSGLFSAFSGGAGSVFSLWLFVAAGIYPLLLPPPAGLIIATLIPVSYLVVGATTQQLLPIGVALTQAALLALLGSLTYSWRNQARPPLPTPNPTMTRWLALAAEMLPLTLLVDAHGHILAQHGSVTLPVSDLQTIIDPSEAAAFQAWLAQLASTPGRVGPATWCLHQDGTCHYWEIAGQSCLDQPDIAAIILSGREITTQVEEARLHAQARQLDSLGKLASGFAHDFNNLFTAILGQTTLALARLPAGSPPRYHLESALQATEQAAALSRKLQVYAGRPITGQEILDLNQLVQEQVSILDHLANLRWQLNLLPNMPAVALNSEQVSLLLSHLLINAVEAIGDRPGTITVQTDLLALAADSLTYGQHTGQRLPAGQYLQIIVGDSGSGMDEATQARLFEPFFSTKSRKRGLGLALVLGIVRSHRGGIRVESSPGRGTTVTLLFPTSQMPTPSLESARPGGTTPRLKIVLVISSSETTKNLLDSALTQLGARMMYAPNVATGQQLYAQYASSIRLVLLDVERPAGDTPPAALTTLQQTNPAGQYLLVADLVPNYRQADSEITPDELAVKLRTWLS